MLLQSAARNREARPVVCWAVLGCDLVRCIVVCLRRLALLEAQFGVVRPKRIFRLDRRLVLVLRPHALVVEHDLAQQRDARLVAFCNVATQYTIFPIRATCCNQRGTRLASLCDVSRVQESRSARTAPAGLSAQVRMVQMRLPHRFGPCQLLGFHISICISTIKMGLEDPRGCKARCILSQRLLIGLTDERLSGCHGARTAA